MQLNMHSTHMRYICSRIKHMYVFQCASIKSNQIHIYINVNSNSSNVCVCVDTFDRGWPWPGFFWPLALAMTVAAVPEIFNEIQLNARASWKGTHTHTNRAREKHLGEVCECVCVGNSLHLNNCKIHTLGYSIGRKPNRQKAHKCICVCVCVESGIEL